MCFSALTDTISRTVCMNRLISAAYVTIPRVALWSRALHWAREFLNQKNIILLVSGHKAAIGIRKKRGQVYTLPSI